MEVERRDKVCCFATLTVIAHLGPFQAPWVFKVNMTKCVLHYKTLLLSGSRKDTVGSFISQFCLQK